MAQETAVTIALSDHIALISVGAVFGLEAWKVKEKAPRIVIGVIALAFFVAGLFLHQIANQAPQFGSFVSRAFDPPSSWLMIFLALFFVARPYWTRSAAPPANAEPLEEKTATVEEFSVRIEKLEFGFSKQTESLKRTSDELSRLKIRADEIQKIAIKGGSTAEVLPETISNIAGEIATLAGESAEKYSELRRSFRALAHKEHLDNTGAEIVEKAQALSSPSQGSDELRDEASWDAWCENYEVWEGCLESYIEVASRYLPKIKRVLSVEDTKYAHDWGIQDSQFPNSEAVRRYKRFRILYDQWRKARPYVTLKVRETIFEGVSENA